MSVKLTGRVVTAMDKFLGKTKNTNFYLCDGSGYMYAIDTIGVLRWKVPLNDPLGFEGKFYDGKPFPLCFEKNYPAAQSVYLCDTECYIDTSMKIAHVEKFVDTVNKVFEGHFTHIEEKYGEDTEMGWGLFDAKYLEKCVNLAKAIATHNKAKPIIQMVTYKTGMTCKVISSTLGTFEMAVAGRTN